MQSRVPSDGGGGGSAGRDADACPGREDGGEEGREKPAGDAEAGGHHCDPNGTRDAGGGLGPASRKAQEKDPGAASALVASANKLP